MPNMNSIVNKSHESKGSRVTRLVLILVFCALVLVPLIRMFFNLDAGSVAKVMESAQFGDAAKNSVTVSLVSALIAIAIAYGLAWVLNRTRIPFKGIISIVIVLPMLLPSLAHGMGLIVLFGNNGLITNLLGLDFSIYGMAGIVVGSVMYAFPVAFLMLDDVLKYEDASPYQAASVLGIPKWRQAATITWPYLRKPLISVVFATFTLIVTDYGVPLMVGGKFYTLPVLMYQEVVGQLDFGRGCVYGAVLLIPAVIAFVVDLVNKDKGNSAYVTRPFDIKKSPARDGAALVYCALVAVFVALPLIAFIVLGFAESYPRDLSFSLDNIAKTLNMRGGEYLANSLVIATLTACFGVVIAFSSAYFTARMKSKASRVLHLLAITSMAIPGLVLGLAYVITFNGSFVYGTLIVLIMVNTTHFISSPYLMMYNSFGKLNENLEAVGETLGIGRLRMVRDVFIPQSASTLCEMFSYFFVNSMITISAVSFLATTANKPVALMINQFEAQAQIECAAVVSLSILLANLLVKGMVHFFKLRVARSGAAARDSL